jgi:hypothetical protein
VKETPACGGESRLELREEDQPLFRDMQKILKHLGLWELTPRPPPRIAKAQPLCTEPWIDYSDTQVCPSDNGLYHHTFIQNSRYVFEAEEHIALPF